MDYTRFLNEISLGRKPSATRELTKLIALSPKPIIKFGTGFPNPDMYPFEEISVKTKDGQTISLKGSLLNTGLQYGPSDGYPELLKLLKTFQQKIHSPPLKSEWSLAMTSGSQDAMCKSFEMLLNRGDYVIAEEYVYSGTIAIMKPYNVKHLKVKGDKDGIRPDSLREVLKPWNPKEIRDKKTSVPKVIYTIPNGSNPVGTSISAERKREIYKIAQEYNLLILEDDPYYFLSFEKERAPSFLSLDTDGRVLRFDSFSKILSGGLRVGYITGPQPLIERLVLHMQVSNVHLPSAVQIIVYELLNQWGFDKFCNHCDMVAKFYETRRDFMCKYATKWLKGLADWNVPSAGMFLWIRILGVDDTENLITKRLLPSLVSGLPGKVFTIDNRESPYLRVSFSIVTNEEMDKGFETLANCIREEIGFHKG